MADQSLSRRRALVFVLHGFGVLFAAPAARLAFQTQPTALEAFDGRAGCKLYMQGRLPRSMGVRNHAFTLVELLVVITIVAVLAGVLLPILGAVQENGRTVACASNLRQIGAALLSFAGDNNGVLPLAGASFPYQPPAQRNGGALGWTEQLEPYVGTDRTIYICPSSKRLIANNVQYGYFMGCHAAYVANQNQFAAVRLPLLSATSKYILGGDISSNSILDGADDSDKDDYTQDPGFASTPSPFHRGKVNLLFADGHVGAYAAFDPHVMTTHYDLKADGTGYNYLDQ